MNIKITHLMIIQKVEYLIRNMKMNSMVIIIIILVIILVIVIVIVIIILRIIMELVIINNMKKN